MVPPFECAWLTGNEFQFRNGSGCLCFEAKGETDITVILKSTPGSKRLQPLLLQQEQQQQQQGAHVGHISSLVEPNYTVILGSHRNSCLKFEKSGKTFCQLFNVGGSKVSHTDFARFWVDYNNGVISVGTGEPEPKNVSHRWADPEGPIPNIQHAGLSCWDRHASYRNFQVRFAHWLMRPSSCTAECKPRYSAAHHSARHTCFFPNSPKGGEKTNSHPSGAAQHVGHRTAFASTRHLPSHRDPLPAGPAVHQLRVPP